jgi:tetratricopeptide (TPR) repeat protein
MQSSMAAARAGDLRGTKIFLSLDRQTLLLCAGLIAVVSMCYYSATHNAFLNYDDNTYITDNAHVTSGLTWSTLEWAFTSYDESNWHPLTWLSHSMDCQLFGLNAAGHHLMNVLFHAVNSVLLFLLLQSVTGFRWRSLMVASLFALHPINVESVAWAAERKNVLSMMFFLLALCAYDWYARRPEVRRYAAVLTFYAIALMCKPQVITFPFLLWLWDYWPLRRIGAAESARSKRQARNSVKLLDARLILEKVPLLLLSAASAIVTMQAQNAGGAVRDLSHYSLSLRLETAVISYVRYIGKAFWPSTLVAMYPHATQLYPAWQIIAAALLLLLITAAVVWARPQRYLVMGWFWFVGSLVPMIGLVQVGDQAMADRYAYLSFIGLFVMFVWLVADSAQALRISARWLALPACACLIVLAVLTHHQVSYWHDTESFWLRTLALTRDNYIAHKELASWLHAQGRNEEALEQVRDVLAIRPEDATANLLFGDYEHGRGDLMAAIQRYQTVALSSGSAGVRARAFTNLGLTYRQMGQPMKARQCLETSLGLVPRQPTVMVVLGLIAETNGDLNEAVQRYSGAMALQPTDVGFLLLAHALRQQGRQDDAKAMMQRAARVSSNLVQAQEQAESLLAGK